MADRTTEVVIVGAGIMGAATAWRVARRGCGVTLIEQFDLDHVRGSSHGASRIFRLAYDEADYVHLAREALPLWREAEAAHGVSLLRTTGGLDLGPPENLAAISDALGAEDVEHEHLSHADVERRFAAYRVPAGWEAIYQADTAVLSAETCRQAFLRLAEKAGARILTRTRARRLIPGDGGVLVETDAAPVSAARAIVTAAGWSNQLLEPLGLTVPMQVTRELVCYFGYAGAASLLPFIWHASKTAPEFYGLPNAGRAEAKVGEHKSGPEVDPDSKGDIDETQLAWVQDFVREYVPGLEPHPRLSETCLYASTPDDDFVLDREGAIVLGLGFGGHGFKFAPLIGEILADLAQDKPAQLSERFSYQRFAAVS